MTSSDELKLLSIYLDDHWALAAAGRNIARRMLRHNRNTEWSDDLAWLSEQIESDDRTLSSLRSWLGVDGGTVKRALAMMGERVSRLKPNGRIVRYSPLSRVLEAEAMMSGVAGKQRLWAALRSSRPRSVDLSGFDFEDLEERAERQMELLRAFHHEAAAAAFGADALGGP